MSLDLRAREIGIASTMMVEEKMNDGLEDKLLTI